MKLAFSTLACPQWSIEQVIESALRLGYEGVELRLLDGEIIDPVKDVEKVTQAVALCRSRGLEVCALDTSCSFNHSDPEVRAQNSVDLRNWIQLAQQVQVPLLRIFGGAGKPDTFTTQQENEWVAEALREIAPVAEQAKVTVVLETHDGFSSARRSAQVLEAVNSPYVAALWDSHHPFRVGETAEEVGNLLRSRIAHVHIKDARRDASARTGWQLTLMGEGEVPVREQLQILNERGYTGYVSVEWEKKWHPDIAEPEVALPQHATWFKSLSL